jgi:hypothetical protein
MGRSRTVGKSPQGLWGDARQEETGQDQAETPMRGPVGASRSVSRARDLHPDGESFLFLSQPGAELTWGGEGSPVMLEVVVNWFEELRERMGN